jgi:uncharacterized protein
MSAVKDSMEVPWQVTPEKVEEVVERIVALCNPRRLILFGSYVQGTMRRDSDLDVLVVTESEVGNPRGESVRIRRALKGIMMPMDILVVAESRLRELAETPGLIYREAIRCGKVVYER